MCYRYSVLSPRPSVLNMAVTERVRGWKRTESGGQWLRATAEDARRSSLPSRAVKASDED
jgi:hypothetical protein